MCGSGQVPYVYTMIHLEVKVGPRVSKNGLPSKLHDDDDDDDDNVYQSGRTVQIADTFSFS